MKKNLNQPLYPETFYHIYNRGNNREILFYKEDKYSYFLDKYLKYLSDVLDTYCYCLLPNHFHFLIKVKSEKEIQDLPNLKDLANLSINEIISEKFRLFFLGYAKAINKQQNRHGSLFQKPFRRIPVTNERYFNALIYYIHNNPVHHGIANSLSHYSKSSYHALCEDTNTRLKRDEIIRHFGGIETFMDYHRKEQSLKEIQDLIIEEDD